jgi:hypothetical protein
MYSDVTPLLYTLIDDVYAEDRMERVRMLLGGSVDVYIRVRC